MILLRKKDNDSTPGAFRPISLLNCLVKWITKVLAARLQKEIMKLVDDDQSGFVKTRCIADNFIYATDLIQTCKQKKKKAMVLKLDFRKAFDTVSWAALFKIMVLGALMIFESNGYKACLIPQKLLLFLTGSLVNGLT